MQVVDYIGIPWVSGGQDTDGFDCWGMVRHWNALKLDTTLPHYPASPDQVIEVARTIRGETSSERWLEISTPTKNCIVAMGKNSKVTHVGVFIGESLVLHCSREAAKCVVQSTQQIRRQWKTVKYYLPNDPSNPI